jgi:hypothetical protein
MDLQSSSRRYDNPQARDTMLDATETDSGSWYLVPSDGDGRKKTGINMIEPRLANIPWKKLPRDKIELPKRLKSGGDREPDYSLKCIPAAHCGPRAQGSAVPRWIDSDLS